MEDLQNKIEDQEEEYDILMEEKRIEEERIFNEMAYQFLVNRAARVIQRYWRKYRETRQARRKGKRGIQYSLLMILCFQFYELVMKNIITNFKTRSRFS